MREDNLGKQDRQGSVWASEYLSERLYEFTKSVLWQLSRSLDRCLVQTFFDLLMVILIQRHRNQGLLLSELGGQLLGMGRAPAGTKRIAQLIHSPKWLAELLEDWVWRKGIRKLKTVCIPKTITMLFEVRVRSRSRRASSQSGCVLFARSRLVD